MEKFVRSLFCTQTYKIKIVYADVHTMYFCTYIVQNPFVHTQRGFCKKSTKNLTLRCLYMYVNAKTLFKVSYGDVCTKLIFFVQHENRIWRCLFKVAFEDVCTKSIQHFKMFLKSYVQAKSCIRKCFYKVAILKVVYGDVFYKVVYLRIS